MTQTSRPYSLSPCVWGIYIHVYVYASVCFKLSFIHTRLKHHVHIVYHLVCGGYIHVYVYASVCFKLSFIHTRLKHHVHIVYVWVEIYKLHVICLSARMNTVYTCSYLHIVNKIQSLTSTVNLKGSRSHVSGLAGTQSK